mgnify:CR=1 FL=1
MAAILKGVTVLFGTAVQTGISNFLCQACSVDKDFELNDKAPDETGVTVTLRYDGVQRSGTVEGIAKTTDMPEIGDAITVKTKTDVGVSQTINGVVESVSEKGSNKDFVRISVKFRQLDAIASYV